MKKYLAVFLCILALFVIVSCDNTKDDVTTSDTTTTETETSTQTVQTTEAPETIDEAKYMNIIKQNTERAFVIGDATVDYYMSVARGNIVTLKEKVKGLTSTHLAVGGVASVWHYTSFYAMTSKLLTVAEPNSENYEKYNTINQNTYSSFDYYKGTADIVTYKGTIEQTMYAVNRASRPGAADISGINSVYDDQMWMIREFVYSYKQTQNIVYLNEACRLAKACIDGWDCSLDKDGNEYGGITWGPGYSSKHTCSNAPLIAPLVEIYEIMKEKGSSEADYYLDWAKKIYEFTYDVLRNGTYLYGDLVGSSRTTIIGDDNTEAYKTTSQNNDKIDATTYTYNTGAMISGGAALYRVTEDKQYLAKAKQSAQAAFRIFPDKITVKGNYLYPIKSQTTWFNLVLLEGFIELYPYDKENCKEYIESFQLSLDYAYENHLKDGFLPRNYLTGWDSESDFDINKNVMDQASAAEMYALLAIWSQSLIDEYHAANN